MITLNVTSNSLYVLYLSLINKHVNISEDADENAFIHRETSSEMDTPF